MQHMCVPAAQQWLLLLLHAAAELLLLAVCIVGSCLVIRMATK